MGKRAERAITVAEAAFCAGTTQVVVQRLLDYELIEPVRQSPEPMFDATVIGRIHRILRLHNDLDVEFGAMPLVLALLDRVDRLEREQGRS